MIGHPCPPTLKGGETFFKKINRKLIYGLSRRDFHHDQKRFPFCVQIHNILNTAITDPVLATVLGTSMIWNTCDELKD